MHFSALYIREDLDISKTSATRLKEDFGEQFCHFCGERDYDSVPNPICDWFEIGGRWGHLLEVKDNKGKSGEPHYSLKSKEELDEFAKESKTKCDFANIKDLNAPIDSEKIYFVILNDEIVANSDDGKGCIEEWVDKVNNKTLKGLVAVMDLHD